MKKITLRFEDDADADDWLKASNSLIISHEILWRLTNKARILVSTRRKKGKAV